MFCPKCGAKTEKKVSVALMPDYVSRPHWDTMYVCNKCKVFFGVFIQAQKNYHPAKELK